MIVVRFVGTPVREFLDLQEALDGYRREMQLASLDGTPTGLPEAVTEGLVELRDTLDEVRNELHDQARTAREAGRVVADLVGHYPKGSRDALLKVMSASEAADDAAQRGTLLGPPLDPAVRHVQQWMYHELRTQLEGGASHPYVPPA